jgi:hypothetical protein
MRDHPGDLAPGIRLRALDRRNRPPLANFTMYRAPTGHDHVTVSGATLRSGEHDITDRQSLAMMRRKSRGVLILHRAPWCIAIHRNGPRSMLLHPDCERSCTDLIVQRSHPDAAIACARSSDHPLDESPQVVSPPRSRVVTAARRRYGCDKSQFRSLNPPVI